MLRQLTRTAAGRRVNNKLSFRHSYWRFQSMSTVVNNSIRFADSSQSFANFDLVKRVALDKTGIVVSKWQSRVTGLTVVHLDHEGKYFSGLMRLLLPSVTAPLVNGYFVVATESMPNSMLKSTSIDNTFQYSMTAGVPIRLSSMSWSSH